MSKFDEIAAIKQLKYKYFRCLDTKDWVGIAETFTEDARSSYDSRKYAFEGREAIVKFLRDAPGSPPIVSRHQGHHPEIELPGEDAAKGLWYLEDYVIFRQTKTAVRGAAFYSDEYLKQGGAWRIRSTGYERTYEILESLESVQNLRTMFDGSAHGRDDAP